MARELEALVEEFTHGSMLDSHKHLVLRANHADQIAGAAT